MLTCLQSWWRRNQGYSSVSNHIQYVMPDWCIMLHFVWGQRITKKIYNVCKTNPIHFDAENLTVVEYFIVHWEWNKEGKQCWFNGWLNLKIHCPTEYCFLNGLWPRVVCFSLKYAPSNSTSKEKVLIYEGRVSVLQWPLPVPPSHLFWITSLCRLLTSAIFHSF